MGSGNSTHRIEIGPENSPESENEEENEKLQVLPSTEKQDQSPGKSDIRNLSSVHKHDQNIPATDSRGQLTISKQNKETHCAEPSKTGKQKRKTKTSEPEYILRAGRRTRATMNWDGGGVEEFTLVLPYELSEKILQYLTPQDLCQFSMVCVQYREAANSDRIWLHHCMVRGWLRFGVSSNILSEVPLYMRESNVSGNSPLFRLYVPEDTRLSPICKWKHVFMRVYHLNKNWAKGRYTVSPILRGHKDKVSAMDCSGYTLVSGSHDKQLKVWDIRTCECLRTIRGHTDMVTAVKIKDHFAITGCGDSAVRVFDLNTGKVVWSFQGHSGSVDHIHLVDELIISAATDRTLRVWSLKEKCLLHTLRGHDDDVECVAVHGRRVVSGSWDKTLILWDLDTGKILLQCRGHTEAITTVQFDEKKAVTGSADGDIRLWNLDTGECDVVMSTGSDNEVYCVVYNSEVIVSGSYDSLVRIWSLEGKLLHALREHLGVVRCLHINNERLVSGGDQKKICIWDYRKGKLLNAAHRHPTRLQRMWVGDTRLVTASPDTPGTMTILSYW